MDSTVSQDIKDLYDICMNKNYKTRPKTEDLLKLDTVQKWAKDLKIMNH